MPSRRRHAIGFALLVGALGAAAAWAIPPARTEMLNRPANALAIALGLALLTAPFLLLPFRLQPRLRSTRIAWALAGFMAIDNLMLLLLTSGAATRGHPPLEVLIMLGVGVAKLAALPAALALLAVGSWRGERGVLLAAGACCLGAEVVGSLLIL